MTPVDEDIDDGPSWNRTQPPATDAEQLRRRQFMRRRATALGALVLLIIWIATLASAGDSHRTVRGSRSASGRGAVVGAGAAAGGGATAGGAAASAAVTAQQAAAIKSTLGYTDFMSAGSANHREIALTFDDGPGPFTPQVLAILERTHTPATFFVVGRSLHDFGQILPRELADGFAIGDHTQDHSLLTRLAPRDQASELLDQASAIRSYGAPFPHLFRPPYGAFDKTTLGITRRYGMLTILWTVDTKDFSQPGVGAIVRSVLAGARPGAIILMHDAGGPRAQTVAALPTIIRALRKRRFALVTVPRLVADDPPLEAQTTPPNLGGG